MFIENRNRESFEFFRKALRESKQREKEYKDKLDITAKSLGKALEDNKKLVEQNGHMETIVKGLRDEFTTLQDQYKTEIDSMVELVDLHKQNRLDAEEENSKLYNYAKELQIEYLDLDNYYKNLLKTESRRHKDLQSINLSLKAKYSSLKEKNN